MIKLYELAYFNENQASKITERLNKCKDYKVTTSGKNQKTITIFSTNKSIPSEVLKHVFLNDCLLLLAS